MIINKKLNYYTIVDFPDKGKIFGKFSGEIPKKAGSKAFSHLIKYLNKNNSEELDFEGKFNWDMILLYVNNISLEFISNEDLEIKRRCKYKIQYDTEHELEHQAELDKHNELIRIREVYDKDIIDKYDDDMRKYIFIKDTHEVLYAKYIENKKIYDEELKVFITANVKKLCDTCARCDFKNYKYNACDPADCSSLTGYTQDEMRAKLYKIIEIYKLSHNVPIEIKKITAPRLNIDDE